MVMKARTSLYLSVVLAVALTGAACSKAPNDGAIQNQVQAKFGQDSGLSGKQLGVQSSGGVVTLSGTVDNDSQRDAASRQAASVPGVKEVVNNLQITPTPDQTAQAAPMPTPTPEPEQKPAPSKPMAEKPRVRHREKPVDTTTTQNTPSDSGTVAQITPPPVQNTPAPPPPPPPPVKLTIPSGTVLAVRLVDTLDSEKNQAGQTFHATLDSPVAVDGETAIAKGSDVEGHIVDLKSAGKFAGQSLLVLQLDRIAANGKYYNLQTDQFKREGSSRGKNTAEKVGAGAGIGAIIGALAGGGKGAAIGAAAGGGLGGGVQAATKGQQIKLPSESVLNFTLSNAVTVTQSGDPNSNRQRISESNQ
jgi:outer membrane biosynthesis protein TonB